MNEPGWGEKLLVIALLASISWLICYQLVMFLTSLIP